jgi:precorrin isomerase
MHVVVNHLRFRDPMTDATAEALRDGLQLVVDAGGISARVVKVDDRHLILLLEFASAEDADRAAREAGGPWMREHIVPLLSGGTERSLGQVIASTSA